MVFSVVVVFVVFMSIGLYMMWRGICTGDLSLFHPLLPCQALGQALIPLPSRERGNNGGWFGLVHPCHRSPLWIADQVRNDGVVVPRGFIGL